MSKEILMVVDAVSNEKGVEKEIVFEAIEAALASATRRKHGEDIDVRVAIDRETGNYDTWRRWMVFADESTELEEPDRELRMIDAVDIDRPEDLVEPGRLRTPGGPHASTAVSPTFRVRLPGPAFSFVARLRFLPLARLAPASTCRQRGTRVCVCLRA